MLLVEQVNDFESDDEEDVLTRFDLEALTSSGSRVSIQSVDDNVPLDLTAEGCLVGMIRDTLGRVREVEVIRHAVWMRERDFDPFPIGCEQ